MIGMSEKKIKILILEDDHFLSSLIRARLEKDGYEVVQAFDGEEGLDVLRHELPALLILDIILPRMTGFEVLEAIAASPQLKETSVIVLSNLAQDTDIERAKRMGAVAYFVKVRVSLDELLGKIKDITKR